MLDALSSWPTSGRKDTEFIMSTFTTRNAVSKVKTFIQDEEAASAAEYGILAALVAVAIISAVTLFGNNLKGTFNTMANNLPSGAKG